MKLKFESPDQDKPTTSLDIAKWAEVAAQLKARPGEWALVAEDCPSNMYQKLRYQTASPLRGLDFEVTTRGNDYKRKVTAKVYARFVGDV